MRAVTFDLWQTLMHDERERGGSRARLRAERIHRTLRRAGHKLQLETVEAALREVWDTWEVQHWARHEDPGFDAQIGWLRDRLSVPAELESELQADYVEPIFDIPPRVDPEARPALLRLRDRGLPVGLICNTSVTPGFALRHLLEGWGLGQLLSAQLYSDELGVRKPAPAIFQEAAKRLGEDISAMVHIGDRQDVDVEGAIQAGARGLLVGPNTPLSKLVSTLTSS